MKTIVRLVELVAVARVVEEVVKVRKQIEAGIDAVEFGASLGAVARQLRHAASRL